MEKEASKVKAFFLFFLSVARMFLKTQLVCGETSPSLQSKKTQNKMIQFYPREWIIRINRAISPSVGDIRPP